MFDDCSVEVLTADPAGDGERKQMLEEERQSATHLSTLWNFGGVLQYSPIFYGYYTDRDNRRGYRLPLAYFMTGLALYVYSFVVILRKMAANSRMSKLSEKEDECVFTWKLLTGWDYMIGNAETAHNKVASTILGFKEALLEEAEKQREKRNWRIITVRILVNVTVLLLLASSAFAVVFAVQRSTMADAQSTLWRQNETSVIINIINFVFPALFECIGILERYHPRKTLRLQLARIMFLNLLNLYSLIFSMFSKIHEMTERLDSLRNKTCNGSEALTTPLGCRGAVHCVAAVAMMALSTSSPPTTTAPTTDSLYSPWQPPLIPNVSFSTWGNTGGLSPTLPAARSPLISDVPDLSTTAPVTSFVYDRRPTTSAPPTTSTSDISPGTRFILETPSASVASVANTPPALYWSTDSSGTVAEGSTASYSIDVTSPGETTTDQAESGGSTKRDGLVLDYLELSPDSDVNSDDASVLNFSEPLSSSSEVWTEAPTSSIVDDDYLSTTSKIEDLRSATETVGNNVDLPTSHDFSTTARTYSTKADSDEMSIFDGNAKHYADEQYSSTSATLTASSLRDGNAKHYADKQYSSTSATLTASSLRDSIATEKFVDTSLTIKGTLLTQTSSPHLVISTTMPTTAVETTEKGTQCLQYNCSPEEEDIQSKRTSCYDPDTRKELRTLCWETMFGQEMVKMTVMDLVMTILSILSVDFFRAVFVRIMNNCWCWDLEKRFPQYGDFKIAENILHLVNNQGMVWMGMFFSPGLGLINMVKLVVMVYLRSWAVLTCNVPHEVVFRASRSNNFYFALLLAMLFFCVLPVGYAVVWLRPSWHCGPFSTNFSPIYTIFTKSLRGYVPAYLHIALDYAASPGIVIPLLLLLSLVIYYLVSLTNSLREANNDLKVQLRRERTEERRRMFQLVERRKRGSSDMADKWKKLLPALPASSTRDGESTGTGTHEPSTGHVSAKPDHSTTARRKELLTRLLKHALRKSSATSDEESGGAGGVKDGVVAADPEADADGTDAEQPDSLPEDGDGAPAKGRPSVAQSADAGRHARSGRPPATVAPPTVASPTNCHREREDSVASAWSDNIPEIRISKTESTDCIVDVDTDLDPDPDATVSASASASADHNELNPVGSSDTVVAADDLAEKQKQKRRKSQVVARAILREARRRRDQTASVSSS